MSTDGKEKDKLCIPVILICLTIALTVFHFFHGKADKEAGQRMDYSWTEASPYIAHALGGIDGHAYTNSREALEEAYKNGYRNIETDFEYSSDGELVLIHNFKKKTLKDLFGMETEESEKILSSEEFLSMKIYGEYTPMTMKDLLLFMADHGDMYLILDGKYDTEEEVKKEYSYIKELSEEADPDILNRMVPQIYNEEMYDWIMDIYDWRSVIFTWYKLDENSLDPEALFDFCKEKGIGVCTMEDSIENPLINKTAEKYGVMIYVHTINDPDTRDRLIDEGVKGIYTDYLTGLSFSE